MMMLDTRSEAEIALDNTLRYLYITLRRMGASLVAIEFKHNGTIWRADTVAEAVALRDALEKSDIEPHREMDKLTDFWTPDRFLDVIDGIGELQHRFLVAIRHKRLITSK